MPSSIFISESSSSAVDGSIYHSAEEYIQDKTRLRDVHNNATTKNDNMDNIVHIPTTNNDNINIDKYSIERHSILLSRLSFQKLFPINIFSHHYTL